MEKRNNAYSPTCAEKSQTKSNQHTLFNLSPEKKLMNVKTTNSLKNNSVSEKNQQEA